MSTDYEIRCACGDRFTRDNWRTPQEVVKLIGLRVHLAALGKSDISYLDGWDAWNSMFPGAFLFFAQHEGHELSVFDEYGRRWSEAFDRKRAEIYAEMRKVEHKGDTMPMLYAQIRDLELEQST